MDGAMTSQPQCSCPTSDHDFEKAWAEGVSARDQMRELDECPYPKYGSPKLCNKSWTTGCALAVAWRQGWTARTRLLFEEAMRRAHPPEGAKP